MPRIFVSSRRADSKIHADNIVDALERTYGQESVTRNITDDIPFGVDTRQYVYDQIAQYDVVLVVIGRNWSVVRDDYNRKVIENPADLIRLAVEMALQQGKLLIPILVDQASMPVPAEIPESLHELCYRRPVEVQGGMSTQRDIKKLLDGLSSLFKTQPQSQPVAPYQPPIKQSPQPTAPPPVPAQPTPPPSPEPVVAQAPEPVQTEPEPSVEEILPEPEPPEPEPEVEIAPPKPRVGTARILPPPFEWVEIPAGAVTVPDGILEGQRTVFVDRFWMAKYPITNAQFDIFVRAANGYANVEWWEYSPQAKAWRSNNAEPKATGFPGDDLPRTNVNWFEAVAFCHWVTAMVRAYETDYVETLPGGKAAFVVTLPSEAQWQRAAQGDDVRRFPWGDDFNPNWTNFKTRKVTSVSQYTKGASPYGIMDLAGNVNEWCLADFAVSDGDLEGANARRRRVLRGGSWGSASIEDLRVSARLWLHPDFWNGSSGFRIVRLGKGD